MLVFLVGGKWFPNLGCDSMAKNRYFVEVKLLDFVEFLHRDVSKSGCEQNSGVFAVFLSLPKLSSR